MTTKEGAPKLVVVLFCSRPLEHVADATSLNPNNCSYSKSVYYSVNDEPEFGEEPDAG
jgi:hypothetical protein